MKPPSIEYFAGLFDGEGHIGICTGNKKRAGMVEMVLCNTHEESMRLIHEMYGGVLKCRDRHNLNKPLWVVVWTGRACIPVLSALEPYLIIKKKQAAVALEFFSTGYHKGHPLSDEIRAHRESLRVQIRSLNKRGRIEAIA